MTENKIIKTPWKSSNVNFEDEEYLTHWHQLFEMGSVSPALLLALFQESGIPVTTLKLGQTLFENSFLSSYLQRAYFDLKDKDSAWDCFVSLSIENLPALYESHPSESIVAALLLHGEDAFSDVNLKELLIEKALKSHWASVVDFFLNHPNTLSVEELSNLTSAETSGERGSSPLPWTHTFAQKNSGTLLNLWLKAGMDINQVDKKGRTPLFYAQDPKMIKFLVDKGAKTDVVDKQNVGIVGWWTQCGLSNEVLNSFQEALGDVNLDIKLESDGLASLNYYLSHLGYGPSKEYPSFDWDLLLSHVFERTVKSTTFKMNVLDAFALHCLTYSSENNLNLFNSYSAGNPGSQRLATIFFEGYQKWQKRGVSDLNDLADENNFLFHLIMERGFFASVPYERPTNNSRTRHGASIKGLEVVSRDWFEDFSPEIWVKTVRSATKWAPFMERFSAMRDQLVAFIEQASTLCEIKKSSLFEDIWTGNKGFNTQEEYEDFWITALRTPLVAECLIKLQPLSLPVPSSSKICAAQFNAWAYHYQQQYLETESSYYSQSGLSLDGLVKEIRLWLDRGVEWETEVSDKKWFAKNSKLKTLGDFGLRLSSFANKGWLKRSLNKVKEGVLDSTSLPSPRKNRL